jgi:hypothetical protein
MPDTVWTAQHDAKAGEGVKIAGCNADGTANLSRLNSVAGEDVTGGQKVRYVDDQLTVVPDSDEDKRCTLFDGPRRFCQRCSEFHKVDEWMDWCEAYLGAAPIQKCKTCGGDHPLDRIPGNCQPEPNWNESDLPVCRQFISDSLEGLGGLNGVQSMADGKFYTSKAKMRAEYRARGLTEMGNDKPREFKKPKPDRKAIRDAVKRATWQVEHEGATATAYRKRAKKADTAFGPVAK